MADATSLDPADWDAVRAEGHQMLDDMLDHLQHPTAEGEGAPRRHFQGTVSAAFASPGHGATRAGSLAEESA